jgi:hypothetical protein
LNDLSIRVWKGTPISRRTTDGYVNATDMAKANGKHWLNYLQTDRAEAYLKALSRNLGIQSTPLYYIKQGEGAWIHFRVAIDFACWIGAEFAFWMGGWFLEKNNPAPAPAPVPAAALPAERMLDVVDRTVDIFERLGGLDQCDQQLLKDIVRSNLLRASFGGLPALGSADDEEPSSATAICRRRSAQSQERHAQVVAEGHSSNQNPTQ